MDKQENNNDKEYISNLIDNYITSDKYGEWTSIIREIIKRRYSIYEYYMDLSRIHEELYAFTSNVETLRFARDDEYTKGNRTLGYFLLDTKEIVTYLDRHASNEEIYATLTHEIYHALGQHLYSKGTALKYFERGNNRPIGVALNEAFNEYGAYLAYSLNRKENEEKNGVQTSGYETITFAPRLLAAAFGIPERTIVAEGLKNRKKLIEAINRTIGRGRTKIAEKTQYAFTKFEDNLNILYNLDYDEEIFKNLDQETKNKVKCVATEKIIDYSYKQLMNTLKLQMSTPAFAELNTLNKFAYCYYKIEDISQRLAEKIPDYNDKEKLVNSIIDRRDTYGTIITDIKKLLDIKEKIPNKEDFQRYVNLATIGKIDVAIDEMVKKYNVVLSKNKDAIGHTILKEEALKSEFADFIEQVDYEETDNKDYFKSIAKIGKMARKERITNSFRRLINKIESAINPQKSKKLLDSGTHINTTASKGKPSFNEELKSYKEDKIEKTDNSNDKGNIESNKEDVVKDEEDKEL